MCPGLLRTGSTGHVDVKGQHEKEYAWFSIADALPGFTMSAEQAARRIWNAVRRGDGELILSLPAKLLAAFHGLMPGITDRCAGLGKPRPTRHRRRRRRRRAPQGLRERNAHYAVVFDEAEPGRGSAE
ncbi:MAG: hypothetical protein WKG07_33295 [Hymenobacter sp.]